MRLLLLAATLLCASTAQAYLAPLPDSEWNDEALLWLSRAVVAEAGWDAHADHYAIAWVLTKRWRSTSQYRSDFTFVDQIRSYCSAAKPTIHRATYRQKWIRGLRLDGIKPIHWQDARKAGPWRAYKRRWLRVVRHMREWGAGKHPDPCVRAIHWGSPTDPRPKSFVWVRCRVPMANRFYRIGRARK